MERDEIERFLAEFERRLRLPPVERERVVAELRAHLEEAIAADAAPPDRHRNDTPVSPAREGAVLPTKSVLLHSAPCHTRVVRRAARQAPRLAR